MDEKLMPPCGLSHSLLSAIENALTAAGILFPEPGNTGNGGRGLEVSAVRRRGLVPSGWTAAAKAPCSA
jgi:hypothetical protein